MAFPAIRFAPRSGSRRRRRGERGAATVEYGLIVALVATLAAGGAAAMGSELQETFERVCRTLDDVGGVACTRGNGRGNNGNGLGNGGSNGGSNPGGGNPGGGGGPGGGTPGGGGGGPGGGAGGPGGGNPGGGAGGPGGGAGAGGP